MVQFLTLNTGLIECRLLDFQLYRAVPFVSERVSALPDALREIGADVVCLQEINRRPHKRLVAEALSDLYPYHSGFRDVRGLIGSGLMLLSRHPIEDIRINPFGIGTVEERLFSQRAMLDCSISIPALGRCRVVNIHATAGGLFLHPEGRKAESYRTRQIRELLASPSQTPHQITVIVGDLNAGPNVSDANYRQVLDGGYVDAFIEYVAAHDASSHLPITWDPQNPLNAGGPHNGSRPQRIDHVFISKDDAPRFRVADARIVLDEPRVALPHGDPVTVSDHYGLVTRIRRS